MIEGVTVRPGSIEAAGRQTDAGVSRRRVIARSAAALGGLVAAAACGPIGAPADSQKAETKPATLLLAAYTWGNHVVEAWNAALARYKERHPAVQVEFEPTDSYGKTIEKLQVQMAGGTSPDMALVIPDVLPQWAARKQLVDLTPYVKRDKAVKLDEWFGNTWESMTDESGRYFGAPVTWNGDVLYYNINLVDAAGAPRPTDNWTFDDLLAAARRVQRPDPGGDKEKDIWGVGLGWNPWLVLAESFGGRVWDRDQFFTRSTVDRPAFVAGIEYMADLIRRHQLAPPPAGAGGNHRNGPFRDGRVGFGLTWGSWILQGFHDNPVSFTYDIALPPMHSGTKQRASIGQANNMLMFPDRKQPDAAWALLNEVTLTPEAQETLAAALETPALKKAAEGRYAREVLLPPKGPQNGAKVIATLDKHTRPVQNGLLLQSEWMPLGTKIFAEVWSGTTTASAACQEYARQLNALLDQAKAAAGK